MNWKVSKRFRGNLRLYRRHSIRLEARLYGKDRSDGILLLDWSASGVRALVSKDMPQNQEMRLELSFPEDENGVIELNVRTARSRENPKDLETEILGLEFLPGPSQQLKALQNRERAKYVIPFSR